MQFSVTTYSGSMVLELSVNGFTAMFTIPGHFDSNNQNQFFTMLNITNPALENWIFDFNLDVLVLADSSQFHFLLIVKGNDKSRDG